MRTWEARCYSCLSHAAPDVDGDDPPVPEVIICRSCGDEVAWQPARCRAVVWVDSREAPGVAPGTRVEVRCDRDSGHEADGRPHRGHFTAWHEWTQA